MDFDFGTMMRRDQTVAELQQGVKRMEDLPKANRGHLWDQELKKMKQDLAQKKEEESNE